MDRKKIAEEIFGAAVKSVLPSVFMPSAVKIQGTTLLIGNLNFDLERIRNIYVIGAGKATAMMASEIEKILGSLITEGHIIVKHGHAFRLKKIKCSEAGHPVPDSNGFRATKDLLRTASEANEDDLVICLISGGGSALLSDFPEGSTPEEIMILNDLLVNSGACIKEINTVRKHISAVKGGQLARAVYPATIVSLILSDVPGDPLDVIASGPTVPDPTTFDQAWDVLKKYNLLKSLPAGITNYLEAGRKKLHPETPKPGDAVFNRTYNILACTNKTALEAARQKAVEFNINSLILDSELQGDVSSVSEYIAETALRFKNDENEVKPVCLLFGGETTVKVTGSGKGGRNQHLALLVSTLIKDLPGITFLSAGTDGNDGPTNATGAVVDSDTYRKALSGKIIPEDYIRSFDSYHFFKRAGGHIITSPTMTNVMDILVVIID